jgi:hypothetical protein
MLALCLSIARGQLVPLAPTNWLFASRNSFFFTVNLLILCQQQLYNWKCRSKLRAIICHSFCFMADYHIMIFQDYMLIDYQDNQTSRPIPQPPPIALEVLYHIDIWTTICLISIVKFVHNTLFLWFAHYLLLMVCPCWVRGGCFFAVIFAERNKC